MRTSNPLLVLHEALSAALLRDLADVAYETTDWDAVARLRETLAPAEFRDLQGSKQMPRKKGSSRPTADQVDVQLFPQWWGSTALGYGGIGGAAITNAYTVVVSTEAEACVYFGSGRLAYKVALNELSVEQRTAWQQALSSREMPTVVHAREMLGLK